MKTIILDNVLSQKELFFVYQELLKSNGWSVNGTSSLHITHLASPLLAVKSNDIICNNTMFFYGKTIIYRIVEMLKNKHTSIPIHINRMWFNITYSGKKTQHELHQDSDKDDHKSILIFMTPIWQDNWKGSFYVDGEELKYKPGSAVIYNSTKFHTGEPPEFETNNWIRLNCNIIVGNNNAG